MLALLAATGWMAASVFSQEYFAHLRRRNRYYFFWLATLGGTMGVFLSADLFTTFVFFEVMSFTSYVAVVQTEDEAALRAGETYLAVAVIGGLVTLSGLFLIYFQLGTLRLDQLAQAAAAAGSPAPQACTSAKTVKKDVDKPETEEYIDLEKQLAALNERQLAIISAMDADDTYADVLIERTGLPASAVMSELTMLQILGFISPSGSGSYRLNIKTK